MAGFELEPVQGNPTELNTELKELPQHEREENVIPAIQSAVAQIVDAVGGYLSVSVNGNLNPVAGDTGDLIQIYIVSLPNPHPETTTEDEWSTPAPVALESEPEVPVNTENESAVGTAPQGEVNPSEGAEPAPAPESGPVLEPAPAQVAPSGEVPPTNG